MNHYRVLCSIAEAFNKISHDKPADTKTISTLVRLTNKHGGHKEHM